jgi:hypothetical protein
MDSLLTAESELKKPGRIGSRLLSFSSDALFEAGFDEAVEVAVENCLRVAGFVIGTQILDT